MCEVSQPIYKIVDETFNRFVVNNRGLLDEIKEKYPIDIVADEYIIGHNVCKTGLVSNYGVRYIIKMESGEGNSIKFFDENFNLLYDYYDVD